MLSWPHRTSNNIINICFRLLETCAKCSYFIEENMRPGVQRLAFEVKFEYIAHRSTNIPWAGGLRLGKFPDNRRLITLLRVYWCLFSHSMKLRNYWLLLKSAVTVSLRYLPRMPIAYTFNSHTRQNAYNRSLKRTLEDLSPCYCYATKTNSAKQSACKPRNPILPGKERGLEFITRDPTFGEFVPRLGISATFGEKFGELRYLGIF